MAPKTGDWRRSRVPYRRSETKLWVTLYILRTAELVTARVEIGSATDAADARRAPAIRLRISAFAAKSDSSAARKRLAWSALYGRARSAIPMLPVTGKEAAPTWNGSSWM